MMRWYFDLAENQAKLAISWRCFWEHFCSQKLYPPRYILPDSKKTQVLFSFWKRGSKRFIHLPIYCAFCGGEI